MLFIFNFKVLCTARIRVTLTSGCTELLLKEPTLTLGPTQSDSVADRVPPLLLHDVLELPLEVMFELKVPRVRVKSVEHILLDG